MSYEKMDIIDLSSYISFNNRDNIESIISRKH